MPSKQASEQRENQLPPDDESNSSEEGANGRPFWSGTISFGLVSIPVDLYPAVRGSHVGLRMLSPQGEPLKRRYFSPQDGKEVPSDHMVRGYETESDNYVVVTDEELDRLAPEKSRYIQLRQFVDVKTIPPYYFKKAYFLAPSGESIRAYRLLTTVMERTGKAGVADFVMRGEAYPAAIFADHGVLRLETLRYHNELRTADDIGLSASIPDAEEVAEFRRFISKQDKPKLDTKQLRNVEAEQLLALIRNKQKSGKDVVHMEAAEQQHTEVVDILETLKRSLAGLKKAEEPKKDARTPSPKSKSAKPEARSPRKTRKAAR